MNGLVLLIISVAVLAVGYIFYGRWLCKQWGVGELDKPTPPHPPQGPLPKLPPHPPQPNGPHKSGT